MFNVWFGALLGATEAGVVMDLVLVHPPVALPCEPPVGIGVLAAALRESGVAVEVVDANVEALDALLGSVCLDTACTAAERRAVLARGRALAQLRSMEGYAVLDRYRAAVRHLTQLLQLAAGRGERPRIGLADYHEARRSPLCSADLRAAAQAPEESPFHAPFVALGERIAARRPRRIGISVNYLHQALPAMALAGVLRRRLPDVPLLLGGALATCWRGRLAPDGLRPAVTRVVFGDGVAPLLEELGRTSDGKGSVTTPDYAGFPWERYLSPRRIAPVATSRGCVWGRCRYCPEAALNEPFVALPADEVGGVVDEVRRRSEAELVHVTDSAVPLPALLGLARQRWSARWYGFTRFYPDLAEAEVCRALRRSGCLMLQLGLESGSRRVLARLRKGIALDLVGATLRQLADAGVGVYLYVMFGVPGETRDDALRTTELVASHAEHIGYLNTSLLNLPVSSPAEPDVRRTPFGADGEASGSEEANDLTLYSGFVADATWDRRAARRFLEREFARHPQIAPILRRTPPVFGANHAPFFQWGE